MSELSIDHRAPRASNLARFTSTSAICCLICALSGGFAVAQQLQDSEIPVPVAVRKLDVRFQNLSQEDGLSQTTIYNMMQDRKGFMWFGTQDGLNRYDGHEFKVYHNEPFDSTSIMDGWSWGIYEDSDAEVWVALSTGIAKLDPATDTFTNYRHDPGDSMSVLDGTYFSVIEDDDGYMWFGGEEGLSRFDPSSGEFNHFRPDTSDPSAIPSGSIFDLVKQSDGRILATSGNGFVRFVPGPEPNFERYLHDSSRSWRATTKEILLEDDESAAWVTTDSGIVHIDFETLEERRFCHREDDQTGPPPCWYGRIAQDPTNPDVLWIGTRFEGIIRFNKKSFTGIRYGSDPGEPNSISSNEALAVFADRSGVVWVGAKGIDRFNPASVGFSHYRHRPDDNTTIAGAMVWGVFQTSDGELWVSTWNADDGTNALNQLNWDTGEFIRHQVDPDNPNKPGSISLTGITGIAEDRNGDIWVGGRFFGCPGCGGLNHLDRRTGMWEQFYHDPDDSTSISEDDAIRIVLGPEGKLWIATGGRGPGKPSLNIMDPDNPGVFERFASDPDDPTSYPGGWVGDILFASDGAVWIASRPLSRFDRETRSFERFAYDPTDTTTITSDVVMAVLERTSEPGIIWVGTVGGLNRLDQSTGIFTHWTDKDGLPNNTVYAILEDGEGNLWMSTNNGISRFTPETGEFRNYGLEIGLQSLEYNAGAAYKGPFGEMFFGGINGLNAFFPNELVENSVAPIVTLTDFRISNEHVVPGETAPLAQPVGDAGQIRLNYDQKDLAFDFVALHYMNPEKNTFAYQLEGYDDDWIEAGHARTAAYTNVPPGEYTFRVKAANADGVWNEDGASIRVIVEPPFWATWWFRIAAILGFGGMLYLGYSARVHQVEARSRELEQEVDKATHDLPESHEAIKLSNEQLEQSATIVEAINQETSFRALLTKILEEARVIPGIEKATALVYMPEEDLYRYRASAGWDVWNLVDITMTEEQAEARYVDHAKEVAPDIFVTKEARRLKRSEEFGEFGDVASFLVLRVDVEDQVVGYFVFDNMTDEDAFDERDVELLNRLKEHITSAFIKTRLLDDLQAQRSDLQKTLDELRSTQDRLVQSEKMASLGQLSAGIAHEIKNPLNFVNNFSEVSAELTEEIAEELEKRKDDLPSDFVEELQSLLSSLRVNSQKVAEHGKRADSIVQNMIRHSEGGEGERTPTDLNKLLDEYVDLALAGFQSQHEGFKVEIERDYHDAVGEIEIVPQDIGKVFLNLLNNAFDVLETSNVGADYTPKLTVGTEKRKRSVEIRISDNGSGIPDQVRDKIFDPFFTTKPTGSGTGLGLSMSYDIVTKGHGGSLEVESVEGEGAMFIVRLPA